MRLDGRLGDAELIGDLLVQESARDHAEHARLLRRERLQFPDQLGNFRIALDAEFDAQRLGDATFEHRRHRGADLVDEFGRIEQAVRSRRP